MLRAAPPPSIGRKAESSDSSSGRGWQSTEVACAAPAILPPHQSNDYNNYSTYCCSSSCNDYYSHNYLFLKGGSNMGGKKSPRRDGGAAAPFHPLLRGSVESSGQVLNDFFAVSTTSNLRHRRPLLLALVLLLFDPLCHWHGTFFSSPPTEPIVNSSSTDPSFLFTAEATPHQSSSPLASTEKEMLKLCENPVRDVFFDSVKILHQNKGRSALQQLTTSAQSCSYSLYEMPEGILMQDRDDMEGDISKGVVLQKMKRDGKRWRHPYKGLFDRKTLRAINRGVFGRGIPFAAKLLFTKNGKKFRRRYTPASKRLWKGFLEAEKQHEHAKKILFPRPSAEAAAAAVAASVAAPPSASGGVLRRGVRYFYVGHATGVLDIDGFRFLIDPVFGEVDGRDKLRSETHQWSEESCRTRRQGNWKEGIRFGERCRRMGPLFQRWMQQVGQRFSFDYSERLAPAPIKLEALLPTIHGVIVSHDHPDHISLAEAKVLCERNPPIFFFIPRGPLLVEWLIKAGCNVTQLKQHEWWEYSAVSLETLPTREGVLDNNGRKQNGGGRDIGNEPSVDIFFFPAIHWGGRGPISSNRNQWASVGIVSSSGHSFYHSGDTAMVAEAAAEFRKVAAILGPVSLMAVAIGAYRPYEDLRYQHSTPAQSLLLARLLNATFAVGVHWGVFKLGHEPLFEPMRLFYQTLCAAETSYYDSPATAEVRRQEDESRVTWIRRFCSYLPFERDTALFPARYFEHDDDRVGDDDEGGELGDNDDSPTYVLESDDLLQLLKNSEGTEVQPPSLKEWNPAFRFPTVSSMARLRRVVAVPGDVFTVVREQTGSQNDGGAEEATLEDDSSFSESTAWKVEGRNVSGDFSFTFSPSWAEGGGSSTSEMKTGRQYYEDVLELKPLHEVAVRAVGEDAMTETSWLTRQRRLELLRE